GLWRSSKDLIDVNWYIVKLDDSLWLQLDVCLTPAGWKMQFWNRKGTREQARQWLKDREIEVETSTGKLWRLIYNGVENNTPYGAELDEVRAWTISMLKRLTASTVDRSTDSNTSK
ncbi:MAG: hypothetical protein LH474_09970, partial [Chamaesiphon sp.]|nr:hypothetical protein [Chamaesiphon sp.]